jgi:DNA-binding transcriptional LysR family regulator
LSRQIRDLEEELGFLLLERRAKSVRLTEAGRAFLTEACAVLQRAEDAVKAARAIATGGGELHVGYAPSPTARILPAALRAFQTELPNVRVKLHDLSTEEMLAGLRDGRLQIAFVVRLTPAMLRGLRFEELARDSICLAVAPKHPLARRRTVTLTEAAREPLITYSRKDYPEAHEMLDVMFAGIKGKPRIAEEHDSVSSLIAAVESGAGVALAPQSLTCTAGPRLKLIPLSPAPDPLVIGAAWTKEGLTAAAERFLKCAKETASGR